MIYFIGGGIIQRIIKDFTAEFLSAESHNLQADVDLDTEDGASRADFSYFINFLYSITGKDSLFTG